MDHLSERIHSRIGPPAADHGYGMIRHFRQCGLNRFLNTRKEVGAILRQLLPLPSAVVPSDVRDPECVLHARQISNRKPA